jgi:hypothetical protein
LLGERKAKRFNVPHAPPTNFGVIMCHNKILKNSLKLCF